MEPFFNHKMLHFSNNFNDKIKKFDKEILFTQSKTLVIIACHLDKEIKFLSLINNYNLLSNDNFDFIIVYSKNQIFNNKLLNHKFENTKLIEMDNDYLFDFGKWNYIISTQNLTPYEYITFTNDSFYLKSPIPFYFNYVLTFKPDFFSYSSSSEYIYHYQTYLFTIKTEKINIFTSYIETHKKNVSNPQLLTKMEILLGYEFQNKDCLVDLGNLDINNKKNIFFHNKVLYKYLYSNNILPIIKIKLLSRSKKTHNNMVI